MKILAKIQVNQITAVSIKKFYQSKLSGYKYSVRADLFSSGLVLFQVVYMTAMKNLKLVWKARDREFPRDFTEKTNRDLVRVAFLNKQLVVKIYPFILVCDNLLGTFRF